MSLNSNEAKKMLNIQIGHIGINGGDKAKEIAEEYAKLFDCEIIETPLAYFAGSYVEVMKKGCERGKDGHFSIVVDDINKAIEYYKSLGYVFDEASNIYDENNKIKAAYFKDEIGGFIYHLSQRKTLR